jgi:excisionase family DNA binding protein
MTSRTMSHMPKPPDPEQLLTYQECTDIAGVSIQRIKQLAQAREFPVYDLGHRTKRVKRADLMAYLEAKASAARNKQALTRKVS